MLPTSTGAFQTGLSYGNNDDVPGFFWYNKRLGKPVSLNSIQGAIELQESLCKTVAPYPGLISGGSAYCALFTGGAAYCAGNDSAMRRPDCRRAPPLPRA